MKQVTLFMAAVALLSGTMIFSGVTAAEKLDGGGICDRPWKKPVKITARINPDMTIKWVEIVDKGENLHDPEWLAFAEKVKRAVLSNSPLKLPPDKYEVWKTINFVFDPNGDCPKSES